MNLNFQITCGNWHWQYFTGDITLSLTGLTTTEFFHSFLEWKELPSLKNM
jgi:hypothetical protein